MTKSPNAEAISQASALRRDGFNYQTKYKTHRGYSKRHGLAKHKSKETK